MNEKICWICSSLADCREHIHKKTDIVTLFGKGPYPKGHRLIIKALDGSRHGVMQSEDSDFVKFGKSVCKSCNNARTKPYDEAYREFISYVNSEYRYIFKNKNIDLNNVYKKNQRQNKLYLCKYFMKILGCAIRESGVSVPDELVFSVHHKNSPTPKHFFLKFSLCDYFPEKEKGLHGLLQTHDLTIEKTDVGNITLISISWAQVISWLTVEFYLFKTNKITKKPLSGLQKTLLWNGKERYIKLGVFSDTQSQ